MRKSPELENLVRIGTLKAERPAQREFDGLLNSGAARLTDARNAELSLASRFDLAYNAAHALSLAALRYRGYRSDNRYVVFQTLPHTLGMANQTSRVLATAHQQRNRTEYEGMFEITERLVTDVIEAAESVLDGVRKLPPLPKPE